MFVLLTYVSSRLSKHGTGLSLNGLEAVVKALGNNMQENGDVKKINVAKLEAQGLLERLEKVQGD
jgi:hypothetical protein